MNTELIAAILKLVDAQNAIATSQQAIATQLGRIADQLQPRIGPAGADTGISVLTDAVADISATMHEGVADIAWEMQEDRKQE